MSKTDWNIDKSWTLFLDRDGVINQRNFQGYITSIDEFVFLPEVIVGLKRLSPLFQRIIVVTNQQGVAKGIMSTCNVNDIHHYMIEELKNNKVIIDQVYSATNRRGAIKDERKPLPFMALQAKMDFPEIDFKRSVMVGDTSSDIEFGMNLGMKTVLIQSAEKVDNTAHLEVKNLKELAHEIGQ